MAIGAFLIGIIVGLAWASFREATSRPRWMDHE
jgi:hypothetical protein